MFDKNIDGFKKGWLFIVSLALLISGIIIIIAKLLIPSVLGIMATICFLFVLFIWITLYRQWDERRVEKRAESKARSERMKKP
jgi:membrane protein implicated in regulation of membrane protease activity